MKGFLVRNYYSRPSPVFYSNSPIHTKDGNQIEQTRVKSRTEPGTNPPGASNSLHN